MTWILEFIGELIGGWGDRRRARAQAAAAQERMSGPVSVWNDDGTPTRAAD